MLSEYRVLDFTDQRGGLCGQLLADLGADVLRVEPPGGSPMRDSEAWSVFARNCRSRVLDVDDPDDLAAIEALVGEADVVLAHGATVGRLGFEGLRTLFPHLVWVSITPFGASGPKSDYQATDLIIQAAGGAMAITGFADDRPLRTGAISAWSHAGAAAAAGALLALRQRESLGRGQLVDISAQLSVSLTASFSLLTSAINATRLRRVDIGSRIPLIWPVSDGFVSMTLGFIGPLQGFARSLLAWMRETGDLSPRLEQVDWGTYMMAVNQGTEDRANLEALLDSIGRFLKARSKAELLEEALKRRVLLAPVSTTHELLESAQLGARDFWWDSNRVRQPGAFARFSATPLTLRNAAPSFNPMEKNTFPPRRAEARRLSPLTGDNLPLAGVKVLDFSWVMAGPWCTRVMADYGATVVKIESRSRIDLVRLLGPFYGDQSSPETSASFASINAGKLSVELDPNTPDGKAQLLELVDWADVVMESFSPRAMKKWGLDYESLRARKPSIVMLSSCLFGQTGPLAEMAGYGTMGAALAGLVLPTGVRGRPPCGPHGPYTDFVAPRFSLLALLAALRHQERTGEGQYIDQSQAESSMQMMSLAFARSSLGGPAPDRLGNEDPDMFPHDVYPCAGDDQWVAIAVRDDADWEVLADAFERPDWRGLSLEGRRAVREDIDVAVSSWTESRTASDVETQLQGLGVPSHAVNNGDIAVTDPQLAYRHYFQRTQHATLGESYVEGTGYSLELVQPQVGKIPTLGGDADQVRSILDAI